MTRSRTGVTQSRMGFPWRLVPVRVSSLLRLRECFLTTVAAGMLIRDLNPDPCPAVGTISAVISALWIKRNQTSGLELRGLIFQTVSLNSKCCWCCCCCFFLKSRTKSRSWKEWRKVTFLETESGMKCYLCWIAMITRARVCRRNLALRACVGKLLWWWMVGFQGNCTRISLSLSEKWE